MGSGVGGGRAAAVAVARVPLPRRGRGLPALSPRRRSRRPSTSRCICPGRLDPARLRTAFTEALRRHPRILMREAPGPWYRRRYEWELTADPGRGAGRLPAARPGCAGARPATARSTDCSAAGRLAAGPAGGDRGRRRRTARVLLAHHQPHRPGRPGLSAGAGHRRRAVRRPGQLPRALPRTRPRRPPEADRARRRRALRLGARPPGCRTAADARAVRPATACSSPSCRSPRRPTGARRTPSTTNSWSPPR